MPKNIIEIQCLNKSYGDIKAVDNISFSVKKGELFAFLGLNGAGKSTTINIICGLLKKDSGRVLIDGIDIDESGNYSSLIGVVFQNSVLDGALTVKDNLVCRGVLYGLKGIELEKRIEELDRLLDIAPLLKRTVSKLSGGQRRRIDIARALIHKPSLLILDEPTTGLDPQTRKSVWDTVEKLRREQNVTVFLTTHYMEEAADADRVIILDSGRIAAEGTPHQLKTKYSGDYLTLYRVSEENVASLNLPYTKVTDGYRVQVADSSAATELILNNPSLFTDYELIKGKMDDVFLNVTGKKLQNDEGGGNLR